MLDFLNNIPDMTNTPEITMHKSTIPMSKRIRAYKAGNPDADARKIAEALGTTSLYVYQILSKPLGKTKRAKPVAKPKESNPVDQKEVDALKEEIETLNMVVSVLKKQNERNLAVIGYLESKIDDAGGLVC